MSVESLGKSPVGLRGADLSFLATGGGSAKPPEAPAPAGDEEPNLVPEVTEEPGLEPGRPGPEPAPANAAGEETDPPRPPDEQDESQKDAVAEADARPRPIVAYMPVRVRDQLKRIASTSSRTYVDVLFDAVDELDARLPEVFADHLAAAAPTSLFTHRSRRATVKAPTAGKKGATPVQVPFRIHPEDLAVVDERASIYAAGNRSEFIRIVLDAYLNT